MFFLHKTTSLYSAQIAQGIINCKILKIKGTYGVNSDQRNNTKKKQLHFQVELNAIHENIREVLIRNRTNVVHQINRKMLITYFL
jgi:hypothetical protein